MNSVQDIINTLRERTWLSPVSAEEMNRRDRWLADAIDAATHEWTNQVGAVVKKYAYHFPNDDITNKLLADLAALPPAPPQQQELRQQLAEYQQSFALCEVHTPNLWEGDGTCVICEAVELDRRVKELEAKLAASPPAQEPGWQPIATVPPLDDSTLILLCVQGANRSWFGTSMSRGQATHWMPLPHPLA